MARPRNRIASLLITLVAGVVAAVTVGGCATIIIPPPTPIDPTTVYLIDLGRTPSLAMPRDDGGFVRYVYGEWNWYAMNDTGALQGAQALFWPTQGALGRQITDQPRDVNHMLDTFGIAPEAIYPIDVDRAHVQNLIAQLDEAFERNESSRVYSDLYGLEFIPDPQRYTIFSNSNHRAAQWLRELGCETRGWAIFSVWEMDEPTDQSAE